MNGVLAATVGEGWPSPSLTIEWIRQGEDIEPLADAWRALETSVQHRTVLSTFDYNSTWYRHYACPGGAGIGGAEALIGVARRGPTLVGIAPLVVRRRRVGKIPLICVEFAAHEAYAGEFLVEDGHPETIALFLESLIQTVAFDVICLNEIDITSGRFAPLRDVASRHRLGVETTDHPNAFVDVSGGYERYFKGRTAHFRQAVRRHTRRIEDAGERRVDGVVLTKGLEQLDDAIARTIAINEASYKLNGERLADCHRGFLTELAQRFGPRGMLALPILSIGGRNAAYVFGLVERQCFYDITLAYHEAFGHLRPGTHLVQETLRELAGMGVHTVVSHGAHEYKKHWATAFVPGPRLFLFSRRPKALATRFLRFGLRPLWKRIGAAEP